MKTRTKHWLVGFLYNILFCHLAYAVSEPSLDTLKTGGAKVVTAAELKYALVDVGIVARNDFGEEFWTTMTPGMAQGHVCSGYGCAPASITWTVAEDGTFCRAFDAGRYGKGNVCGKLHKLQDRYFLVNDKAELTLWSFVVRPSQKFNHEVVRVKTRGSVLQPILLVTAQGDNKPKQIAIVFPGGKGKLSVRNDESQAGRLMWDWNANYLVKVREVLAGTDTAVAIMDTPSEDVSAVIDELKIRFGDVKIFLVGTSYGSISAAAVGRILKDKVQGVVLTASPLTAGYYDRGRQDDNLQFFPFNEIVAPILFAHHSGDGCDQTSISPVQQVVSQSPAKYALITVNVGFPDRPKLPPCEPFGPHGFSGREFEVVREIKNWMAGQDFLRLIP
jgi:hypothetical protein